MDEIRNKANSVQLSWSWDWAWQYSVRPQIWYNFCSPSLQVCTLFLSLAPTFIQILLLMSPVTRSSEPRCIKSIKVFYFGKTLQIKCDCSNSPQSDTIIESIFLSVYTNILLPIFCPNPSWKKSFTVCIYVKLVPMLIAAVGLGHQKYFGTHSVISKIVGNMIRNNTKSKTK